MDQKWEAKNPTGLPLFHVYDGWYAPICKDPCVTPTHYLLLPSSPSNLTPPFQIHLLHSCHFCLHVFGVPLHLIRIACMNMVGKVFTRARATYQCLYHRGIWLSVSQQPLTAHSSPGRVWALRVPHTQTMNISCTRIHHCCVIMSTGDMSLTCLRMNTQ